MINTFGGACVRVEGGRSGRFLQSDLTKSGLTSGFPELRTNQTVWSWFGVGRIAPVFPWDPCAEMAQWQLGCRTRDRKVAGSSPGKSGGRNFFSGVNFLSWILSRYPLHPRVTAVICIRCLSFCQKCSWQLQINTHAVYVCFCTRFSVLPYHVYQKYVFFSLSMSLICLDIYGFLIKYVFHMFRQSWLSD